MPRHVLKVMDENTKGPAGELLSHSPKAVTRTENVYAVSAILQRKAEGLSCNRQQLPEAILAPELSELDRLMVCK